MHISTSKIHRLPVKAVMVAGVLAGMSGGCTTYSVDDVAYFPDLGNAPDAAVPGDAAARDAATLADAAAKDAAPPPDLAYLHCTGKETFQAARTAMLSSCGGGFGPMGCHSRMPFDGSLDLTTQNAYASLVNVSASIAPSKLRVKPGFPDDSFLVDKLTNKLSKSEGLPMPKGEAILWMPPDQTKLDVLRCWIANGAQNN